MHGITAFVIGFSLWAAFIAYTVVSGGRISVPLITAPIAISGLAALLLAADVAVRGISAVITKKLKTTTANCAVEVEYELESAAGRGNKAS